MKIKRVILYWDNFMFTIRITCCGAEGVPHVGFQQERIQIPSEIIDKENYSQECTVPKFEGQGSLGQS